MLTPMEQFELQVLRRAIADTSDPKEWSRLPEIRGVPRSLSDIQVIITMPLSDVPGPESLLEEDIDQLLSRAHDRAQELALELGYKKVTEVFFRGRGQWYARLST